MPHALKACLPALFPSSATHPRCSSALQAVTSPFSPSSSMAVSSKVTNIFPNIWQRSKDLLGIWTIWAKPAHCEKSISQSCKGGMSDEMPGSSKTIPQEQAEWTSLSHPLSVLTPWIKSCLHTGLRRWFVSTGNFLKLSFKYVWLNLSLPCLMDSSQCGSVPVWPQVFATLLQLIYRWDFWSLHPSSSSGMGELPAHGSGTHLCSSSFAFKMVWTDAENSGFIFRSQHHLSCCSWYSSHTNIYLLVGCWAIWPRGPLKTLPKGISSEVFFRAEAMLLGQIRVSERCMLKKKRKEKEHFILELISQLNHKWRFCTFINW